MIERGSAAWYLKLYKATTDPIKKDEYKRLFEAEVAKKDLDKRKALADEGVYAGLIIPPKNKKKQYVPWTPGMHTSQAEFLLRELAVTPEGICTMVLDNPYGVFAYHNQSGSSRDMRIEGWGLALETCDQHEESEDPEHGPGFRNHNKYRLTTPYAIQVQYIRPWGVQGKGSGPGPDPESPAGTGGVSPGDEDDDGGEVVRIYA